MYIQAVLALGGSRPQNKHYNHCGKACSVLCVLEQQRIDSPSAGPLKRGHQLSLLRPWIEETVRMHEQRQDPNRDHVIRQSYTY
jgi:hypothetical protein